MPHPAIKGRPDLAAVAADIRKSSEKLSPELAGIDEMVKELSDAVRGETLQAIKLRGVIERAQRILTAHMEPDGIPASSTINLLLELLDGPQTRDAMGEG